MWAAAFVCVVGATVGKPRLMATLPAGVVDGIDEELQVYEDLGSPGSPTVFKVQ